MSIVLSIIAIYLGAGLIALWILEMTKHRISKQLKSAAFEARDKLAHSGTFVSGKMATVITCIALFIFWPAAIYGAIRG